MAGLEEIKVLLNTPEPPELGPGPRRGVKPEAELERTLNDRLRGHRLTEEKRHLIRALILLWHDHLDAAHRIAQDIETRDGSLLHGIMHRREPDYGNARYWFRRVGEHPVFEQIGRRVGVLLDVDGERTLVKKLGSGQEWDPFAFIDCCESATKSAATERQRTILREIQAIETRELLEWLGKVVE